MFSSGSICKYIYRTWVGYLTIVLNQNRLFNIQESHFACFAGCEIDNIWIHVSPSVISIFDYGGGQ
jgi:hypothetical protein